MHEIETQNMRLQIMSNLITTIVYLGTMVTLRVRPSPILRVVTS